MGSTYRHAPLSAELCDVASVIDKHLILARGFTICHPDNHFIQLLAQGLEKDFTLELTGKQWP